MQYRYGVAPGGMSTVWVSATRGLSGMFAVPENAVYGRSGPDSPVSGGLAGLSRWDEAIRANRYGG